MLDNKILRRSLADVVKNLARRGVKFDEQAYQELENVRRDLQIKIDDLHAQRNKLTETLSRASATERPALLAQATAIKQEMKTLEEQFRGVRDKMDVFLLQLPNLVLPEVPDGLTENEGQTIRIHGEKPTFSFPAQQHFELCPRMMDFEAAAKIAGSRFVVLRGNLARLQRALTQWMLDKHITTHQYQEVYVPYVVEAHALLGTGQLPKFADDLFRIASDKSQYLTPTAEVPVTNLLRETILDFADLPIRFVSHTPCFRAEAGSYGKDTAGMIRQHQFEKVELVQVCAPEQSPQALQDILAHAESILQDLDLPYRVVHLCAGDTGFASASTYDLEVWLPGQNAYREVSSCSTFTDFQARRAKIRYRREANSATEFAHTVNGSALAVGRTMLALLENRQSKNGKLAIPEVLRPYMGNLTEIDLR